VIPKPAAVWTQMGMRTNVFAIWQHDLDNLAISGTILRNVGRK
jgi:hypothetical protein